MDRFPHFGHKRYLGFGHNRENIAVEMLRAAPIFALREHLAHGFWLTYGF